VTDWLTHTSTFHYDNDANQDTTTYGNTVTGTNTFDNDGRLLTITYAKANTTLAKYTYTHGNAGLLASATPSSGAPGTAATYAYDPNARLQSTAGPTSPNKWVYDAADRLTTQPDATTLTYDDANQLTASTPTSAPATSYSDDNRGNRTRATTTAASTAYGYDQANHLTTVTTGGTTWTYGYDGDGVRASRQVNSSAATTFTWDPTTSLLLTDGGTAYLYGPDGAPIEQIRSGTPTYLHGDQLSSTVLITNQAGAVADTYTYDPYGKVTAHSGTTATQLQYNGQYSDPETGLLYLRARYYDANTAQFLTRDPIEANTGHPYSYAGDDPLDNVDPLGLDFWDNAGDWSAAFGDTVTFGGTEQIRRLINYEVNGETDDIVDHCSVFYQWGGYGGVVANFFDVPAGTARFLERRGLLKGQEIVFSKDFRVAPLGGSQPRSAPEFFPHYHLRGAPDSIGRTPSGQGIGRHRPWESSGNDSSFWDRF
jgi:RHS repeat-associated protein